MINCDFVIDIRIIIDNLTHLDLYITQDYMLIIIESIAIIIKRFWLCLHPRKEVNT